MSELEKILRNLVETPPEDLIDDQDKYISNAIKAIEAWNKKQIEKARIEELEYLKSHTLVTTRPEAFVSDENVAQQIRVHTNSLIEYRLAQLKGESESPNEPKN